MSGSGQADEGLVLADLALQCGPWGQMGARNNPHPHLVQDVKPRSVILLRFVQNVQEAT